MILVRLVFHAKFGRAAELAAVLKQSNDVIVRSLGIGQGWRALTGRGWRILTDVSGRQEMVVMELEMDGLADWERRQHEIYANPTFRAAFEQTAELIEAGSMELYTITAQG